MKQRLLYIFLLLVLFSSCENFLDNQNIKEDITETIAYKNAPVCTVLVKADETIGYFISSGEKEFRLGYSQKLQFSLDSDEYQYHSLEAVCKTNPSISRADCVKFTPVNSIADEKKGIYTVDVEIVKKQDDILIRPVCFQLPSVTLHEPSSPIAQNLTNIPIVINFNMPMEDDIISSEKLFISHYGLQISLSEYFETPVLSNNNQTITIMPKPQDLLNYIVSLNAAFLDIGISFAETVSVCKENTILYLQQNNNSNFSVRYVPQKENVKPDVKDFFVTRTPLTQDNTDSIEKINQLEKFANKTEKYLSRDEIRQNRTGGTVYIYGRYYDKDSGIKNVIITEQRTNNEEGEVVNDPEIQPVEYTRFNINSDGKSLENFWIDADGYTRFCIKYTLQGDDDNPKNGAVLLKVQVFDACDNEAEEQILSVIKNRGKIEVDFNAYMNKKKSMDFNDFYDISNYEDNISILYVYESEEISYYDDHAMISDGVKEKLYKSVFLTGHLFLPSIKYINETGQEEQRDFSFNEDESIWELPLNDLKERNIYSFTLIVKDDIGNISQTAVILPCLSLYSLKESTEDPDIRLAEFLYVQSEGYEFDLFREDSDNAITRIYGCETYTSISLDRNCTYYAVPKVAHNLYGDLLKIEMDKNEISVGNNTINIQFDREKDIKRHIPKSVEDWDYYDLILHIDESEWDLYKSILVKKSYGSDAVIEYGSTEYVFSIDTRLSYQSQSLTFYGITENNLLGGIGSINIECFNAQENIKYDFTAPTVLTQRGTYEFYQVYIKYEGGASPERAVIHLGDDAIELNQQNNFSKIIPYWEIINNTQKNDVWYYFPYESYDVNGNVAFEKASFYIPDGLYEPKSFDTIQTQEINGNSNKVTATLTSCPINSRYMSDYEKTSKTKYIYVYTLTNDDYWINNTIALSVTRDFYSIDQDNGYFEFSGTNLILPKDSFVLLTSTDHSTSEYNYYYTSGGIFYTGIQTQRERLYDLLIPNGNSKTSVAISSDEPVFVHTVVTDESYDVCKNWTAKEWEYFREHIGEKRFNFSSEDHSPRRYVIPVDEIKTGHCYCVIAHFSDNHTEMTEVKIKE